MSCIAREMREHVDRTPATDRDMKHRPFSRIRRRWIALFTVLLFVVTCAVAAIVVFPRGGGEDSSDVEGEPMMRLPLPAREGGMTVSEALARRRSLREFSPRSLDPRLIGQLCWAAQGITDDAQGFRTAPSAGALYPITVFTVDHEAIREYDPRTHSLRQVLAGDVRRSLQTAAHDQSWVGAAPLCLVIAMDVDKTAAKYGERAERYCLLEAGHIAENVLLQATALGLGGVPVGAFDDAKVSAILRLPTRLRPVYLLPLGHPADAQ
jgi:SagB-type dehydrogenase family enzyme